MKRTKLVTAISAIVLAVLLMTSVSGCAKNDAAPVPTEPTANVETVTPAEPEPEPEPAQQPEAADTARQDGEKFEKVIMLEGTEETVKYEHAVNKKTGIEIDFDYELFNRVSEAEKETFVSVHDDQAKPDNYMFIVASPDDTETAVGMFNTTLTFDFDSISSDKITLEKAGECTILRATGAKTDELASNAVETVYVIPAPDGCRIARVYCTTESAEGFGARFADMLNTLDVIPVE